jgi:hypothetical protein
METYSFSDVALTLSHPSLGQVSTQGAGLGSISVSMRTDRTQIDVAADGNPVTSKIKDRTGTLEIQMQQTSNIHGTLKKWFNYLENAATSEWAQITGVLSSNATSEQTIFSGGSMVKHPDVSYEATAGNVTWGFMFAQVTQNNI